MEKLFDFIGGFVSYIHAFYEIHWYYSQ